MRPDFLAYILSSPWAIDLQYAQGYLPIVLRALKGEMLTDHSIKLGTNELTHEQQGGNKLTWVLPIKGAITKYDQFCGPMGTKTMGDILKSAYKDPNVEGVVLDMDSGGGEGSAMFSILPILSQRNKPVIAFVDGLAASAAYGIASHTDEIIVSGKTDMLGSIGTFITFMDVRGYFEKEGIKLHEVYATLSTEKNKEFREAIDGNYKPLVNNLLDPFNELFHDAVKSKRNLPKEAFTGKTYMAEDAIKNNLADHFGDMDFALSRIKELSKSYNKTGTTTMGLFTKSNEKSWAKMSALTETATDEQLDEASNELASNGGVGLEIVRAHDVKTLIAAQTDQKTLHDALSVENAHLKKQLSDAQAQLTAANTRLAGYVEPETKTEKQDFGDGKDNTPKLSGSDFELAKKLQPHLF